MTRNPHPSRPDTPVEVPAPTPQPEVLPQPDLYPDQICPQQRRELASPDVEP